MLELGIALADLGHRVTVACHDHDPDTAPGDDARRLEIRAVRTGSFAAVASRPDLLRRQWLGMSRVARLVPGDVEIVNSHEWPASRAGRLAARRLGVPFVWTRNDDTAFERGLIPETTLHEAPGPLGRLARLAAGVPDALDARGAAEIVVLDSRNAEAVRRAYHRGSEIVRCGPPSVFLHPVDRAAARARLGVAADNLLVLSVGILFAHRRFEDLIDAVDELPAAPGFEVRIVGSDHAEPAYADRLDEQIARSPCRDRINLIRRGVSEDELRDLYAAADVAVFPNRRQAYGLAPLEALASGTPVVLSTGIGVKEILEGRPGVFMAPPEDPRSLAEALRAAMADGARAAASETQSWVRSSLSNRAYAERMLEIYARAIAAGGPTAGR